MKLPITEMHDAYKKHEPEFTKACFESIEEQIKLSLYNHRGYLPTLEALATYGMIVRHPDGLSEFQWRGETWLKWQLKFEDQEFKLVFDHLT